MSKDNNTIPAGFEPDTTIGSESALPGLEQTPLTEHVYEMALFERVVIEGEELEILRVPGGWLINGTYVPEPQTVRVGELLGYIERTAAGYNLKSRNKDTKADVAIFCQGAERAILSLKDAFFPNLKKGDTDDASS